MPTPSKKTSENVPAVSVQGCTVAFGTNSVLENVSFRIEQRQIAAVIGPNGSGKTTLMRAILGLVPLVRGEVRIFGKHLHAVRDLIGYVPQRFDFDRLFPITVREFMDLVRHQHTPRSRVPEKIKEVGLDALVLDKRLGNLSGGQIQRVLIAQAILNNPQILFLDEPSSGIDIAGEKNFYEIIEHLNKEHGTTVILVSHDIAMVSGIVDNVICVNKKLLCYGPPRDALTALKITELFGPQQLYDHPGHEHTPGDTHDHRH